MLTTRLNPYVRTIQDFCKKHPIKKLSVFGSAIHHDWTSSSDIDFLVEFDSDATIGFFYLINLELELEHLLHHKIDLVTQNSLSPYFRHQVIAKAEIIYEKK